MSVRHPSLGEGEWTLYTHTIHTTHATLGTPHTFHHTHTPTNMYSYTLAHHYTPGHDLVIYINLVENKTLTINLFEREYCDNWVGTRVG